MNTKDKMEPGIYLMRKSPGGFYTNPERVEYDARPLFVMEDGSKIECIPIKDTNGIRVWLTNPWPRQIVMLQTGTVNAMDIVAIDAKQKDIRALQAEVNRLNGLLKEIAETTGYGGSDD